jgi:hypothetical protein
MNRPDFMDAVERVPQTEDRQLGPNDRIYDLVDVVEEGAIPVDQDDQEIIVIDGRVYQRVLQPGNKVFDLTDVVEEGDHRAEVSGLVAEITERIAREMIPGIAERVIREEIEKLKE